jgi:cytochrome b pre-mRNA-processing protein 3
MILPVFRRRIQNRSIAALYGAIVAQARSPLFYRAYGVADAVDGRFELLVLHLVLVLRRLGEAESQDSPAGAACAPANAVGQGLFDYFCRDLDDNLREMGVGDLAVPRKMRRFGEAFYGRQSAYCAALAVGGEELEKALARNIFGVAFIDDRARRLARYARAAASGLQSGTIAALSAGRVAFPNPEGFVDV